MRKRERNLERENKKPRNRWKRRLRADKVYCYTAILNANIWKRTRFISLVIAVVGGVLYNTKAENTHRHLQIYTRLIQTISRIYTVKRKRVQLKERNNEKRTLRVKKKKLKKPSRLKTVFSLLFCLSFSLVLFSFHVLLLISSSFCSTERTTKDNDKEA